MGSPAQGRGPAAAACLLASIAHPTLDPLPAPHTPLFNQTSYTLIHSSRPISTLAGLSTAYRMCTLRCALFLLTFVQGEDQKKLDVVSNTVFKNCLASCGRAVSLFTGIISIVMMTSEFGHTGLLRLR